MNKLILSGLPKQTYPADCRKITAVDSHNQYWKKKTNDFCTNNFEVRTILMYFGAEHTPVSQCDDTGDSINTNKH